MLDLDAPSEDVDQSLPLEVFGVLPELVPFGAFGLGAVLVLRLLDPARLVVSTNRSRVKSARKVEFERTALATYAWRNAHAVSMRVPEYTLSAVHEIGSVYGEGRLPRAVNTNWDSLRTHACRKYERRHKRPTQRTHALHLPVSESHLGIVQRRVRLVRVLEQHRGRGALCCGTKLDDGRLAADGVGGAGEDERSLLSKLRQRV